MIVTIFFIIIVAIFICKIVQQPSYEDLLKNDIWIERRDKILKRDNYTCQWCGKQNNLQVHHKYYNIYPNGTKVKPWDYPDDCFITLCDDCHTKCHNKYKIKTYYRKKYKHYYS